VAVRSSRRLGCRDYGISQLRRSGQQTRTRARIPPARFVRPRKSVQARELAYAWRPRTLDVGDEKAFLDFVKECFAQKEKTCE